ncbi:MAG TPA: hypothetical protein VK588_14085 [Chitinophagaceae bacterium]|nr:hypothetical protein [Chitinophagaceae bacterium]
MDDGFDLPVIFENKEFLFPAKLLNYTYSYKIEVNVEGTLVLFEPDEERNWRASIPYEDLENKAKVNPGLLKAIAAVLEELLN